MEEILSWSRIILSLIFLTYASWSDFKTREVSNNVWIVFAPFVFLMTFAEFLFFPPVGDMIQSMVYYGISFGITTIFSITLFYVGAFGGADAKALMCIALAIPVPTKVIKPLSGFVSRFFPISVFSDGVIVASLSVFYTLLRNLLWKQRTGQRLFRGYENESLGRKILTLLCGYKVPVTDLEKTYLYPLEDFRKNRHGEMERRLLLFPRDEDRDAIVEKILKAKCEGKIQNEVWATPGLPMLIFITIGLILALTIGDIVWLVLSQILQ